MWQSENHAGCGGQKKNKKVQQKREVSEWEKENLIAFLAMEQRWNMSKVPQLQSVGRDVGTGQSKEKRAATPTCWAGCANCCWNIRASAYPPTASFSPPSCRLIPPRTLQKIPSMPATHLHKVKEAARREINCGYLHVCVEFRDPGLGDLSLVANKDFS